MQCSEDFLALPEYVFQQIDSVLKTKDLTKIVIGYSGGLDSTVLLHLVAGLMKQFESASVLAIHVNHGAHLSAPQWADHCKSFCESLNLKLTISNFSLGEVQQNREAVYRQARYSAFAEQLSASALLLTAHHQQDQAETVLFNLFRGAGVSGLSAIKRLRQLANGYHLRPLLSVTQDQLAEYAQHHQLSWIDDPSNQDQSFDRNYIRHQLLPLISKRWPAAKASITRSAELLNQANQVLNEVAVNDLADIETQKYPGVIKDLYMSVLKAGSLTALSQPRQLNVLKHWITSHSSLILSHDQLKQIHQDLCQQPGSSGLFEVKAIQIRAFNGFLYLLEKLPSSQSVDYKLLENDIGILFEHLGLKLELEREDSRVLEFRLRRGGETLQLNNQTKTLKTVYQQHAVPPWERDLIPLIYSDQKLIAVPGVVYADNSSIKNARVFKYLP